MTLRLTAPMPGVLLTLVPSQRSADILQAIVSTAELDRTGRGIAFVLPVEQVAGVAHFMLALQPPAS